MMNEKLNIYYWLRLTTLYWLIPVGLSMLFHAFFLPINLSDAAQKDVIELDFLLYIPSVVSAIFYERKIGKIAAWIWVVIWFAFLSFILYLNYQDVQKTTLSYIMDMTPSYRVFVILNYAVALLVPVFLICHKWILSLKIGTKLAMFFVIFVLCCSLYFVGWSYFVEDKLMFEKYREGKQIVALIEDYKERTGRYPTMLSSIDGKEHRWNYELSEDRTLYKIQGYYEHIFNRCHLKTRVLRDEKIEYDSETQKWTRDK